MTAAEKHMETESQTVGKVADIYDKVYAVSADGEERLLTMDDPIFAYDRIVTEEDGRVSIVMNDAEHTQIDLANKSEVLIDEDIFGGVSSEEIAGAAAEVEQVQEAFLIEGIDLTVIPEAEMTDSFAATGERDVYQGHGHKLSEFFDHGDNTDQDNSNPLDPLDHLLNTEDPTS